MKLFNFGTSQQVKESIIIECTSCKSSIKVFRADLKKLSEPNAGCYFYCPFCKTAVYTTEKQEKDLGFPARGD